MSEKKELPVFEIHEKDGKTYKIFADGTIDGFGEDPMIVNRLPVRFTDARAKMAPKMPKRQKSEAPSAS